MSNEVTYTPLGERSEITLTIATVRKFIALTTRSGEAPTDADIIKFVMLCKARELNPWVGDAYLVGYDSKDGAVFTLITAVQALHKRADRCPEYEGLESGVLVKTDDGIEERVGSFFEDGEKCIGAWARVHRSDRKVPLYVRSKRSVFDTGRSYWAKDPGHMITKCAEAAALRKAFPSQTSGLIIQEEFQPIETNSQPTLEQAKPPAGPVSLEDLTEPKGQEETLPNRTEEKAKPEPANRKRTTKKAKAFDEQGLPTEGDGPPKIEVYRHSISLAETESEVRELVGQAGKDDAINDSQYELVESIAGDRIKAIK